MGEISCSNGIGNGNGVNGKTHSSLNGYRKSCWYEEEIEENLRWCFALNSILHTGASRYQDIALLDTKPFGKALIIDGKLQSAEVDEFIYHESLVHPALLHHSSPKTVFIMGGGEGSTAREILRHKTAVKVVMCDIDEEVVDFCKAYLVVNREAFCDPRLEVIINDARAELEIGKECYDVIIGDLADPIEGGPCYKLYTKSFYEHTVKPKLNRGGIFVTQAGPAGIFSHTEVFSCICNTLKQVFKYVVPYAAPANYLLISGDRDFSNALHQLRMRRYNILLAQPQKASAPLLAAAKSVWLWTSLLAGGPPLSEGESLQPDSNSYMSTSDTSQIPLTDAAQLKQPADSYSENSYLANQKSPYTARGYDNKQKGKNIRRSPSQTNGSKTTSVPLWTQEDQHNTNSHQPGTYFPRVPLSGPAPDFVHGNTNFTWCDVPYVNGNHQNHYTQQLRPNNSAMQPDFAAGGFYPPYLHPRGPPPMPARPNGTSSMPAPYMSAPDIGNLNISGYSINFNPQRRNPEVKHDSKKKLPRSVSSSNSQNGNMAHNSPSIYQDEMPNHRYSSHPEYLSSSSSAMGASVAPGSVIWGSPGCPKPSEYVQGLIGVVLLALNTLKSEKIMPTETNIADCIRYGDQKQRNTDIKKALECAIEHQMVVAQSLGAMQLFVGKNEKLWKCVNPIGGSPKQIPKATWDEIQLFLISPAGRSAILASQCRYEAGTILKRKCLKGHALGDILQILNMVIGYKKWIIHHPSGWQPISITLSEIESDLWSAEGT